MKLHAKGIKLFVREAKRAGVKLRQTYARLVPGLAKKHWLCLRGRKYKQAEACARKVKTILGRVLRDIEKKATPEQASSVKLAGVIEMATKAHAQKRGSKDKLYSYAVSVKPSVPT